MGNIRSSQVDPVLSRREVHSSINDETFKRLETAFKNFKKSALSYDDFCYHVLGGAKINEADRRVLFKFCSGNSDTASFDHLIGALVGLCNIHDIQSSFIGNNRQFIGWGLKPPSINVSLDGTHIDFYNVMSNVTHLEYGDIVELERVFSTISDRAVCKITPTKWRDALGYSYPKGFSETHFAVASLHSPTIDLMDRGSWDEMMASCFPRDLVDGLFRLFDENNDGQIDFREMVSMLSTLCRSPVPSRIQQLCRMWDDDGDQMLSETELERLYDDLGVPEDQRKVEKKSADGKHALPVDFAIWGKDNSFMTPIMDMVQQVGHICLGLRPSSSLLELNLVSNFEKRTQDMNLEEWNVVSRVWYDHWKSACHRGERVNPIDNSMIKHPKDDDWGGKLRCISRESARLRPDLTEDEYVRVPTPLWKAWVRWYKTVPSIDGQFTRKYLSGDFFPDKKPALELYPVEVIIYGHSGKIDDDSLKATGLTQICMGYFSRSLKMEKLLKICREQLRLGDTEARLWMVSNGKGQVFLDDPLQTLYELLNPDKLHKNKFEVLCEVRDRGIWPEDMRAAALKVAIKTASTNQNAVGIPGVIGLINSGNFCYRNTALQCMLRIEPVKDWLCEKLNYDILRDKYMSEYRSVYMTYALSDTMRVMYKSSNSEKAKNMCPDAINDTIGLAPSAADYRSVREQHDVQEFLMFLIEEVHKTSMDVEYIKKVSRTTKTVFGPFYKCFMPTTVDRTPEPEPEEPEIDPLSSPLEQEADDYWISEVFKQKNDSIITRTLAGQMWIKMTCTTCKTSSNRFELFRHLSLPIGFEDVNLYQIVLIKRNGEVPRRYGFRVPREETINMFRARVANTVGMDMNDLTIQCMTSRGQLMLEEIKKKEEEKYETEDEKMEKHYRDKENKLSGDLRIEAFPSGSILYALELPKESTKTNWRVAIHRKICYNHEPYFLASTAGYIIQRFGLPLIIGCEDEVTGKELYEDVNRQMQRFMEPVGNEGTTRARSGSENKFTLRIVDENYEWCGLCEPYLFCRGCPISNDDSKPQIPIGCTFAIDWNPTALYLRYNHSQEQVCDNDQSVMDTYNLHIAGSNLVDCLRMSAAPELLSDIDCDVCQQKRQKERVERIWKLPEYLIIQLKRFKRQQNALNDDDAYVKCQRCIDFPLDDFDPTPYVERHDNIKYDCIAIANHYGKLSSGHFIAYARSPAMESRPEQWLVFNDCTVKVVPDAKIDKENAYLMIYRKKIIEETEEEEEAVEESGEVAEVEQTENEEVKEEEAGEASEVVEVEQKENEEVNEEVENEKNDEESEGPSETEALNVNVE